MIQRAAASQKRINEFLKTEPAIKNNPGSSVMKLEGNIAFDNVGFTYPHNGIEALKKFNLSIKSGEKVAIIGKTGSGKSTLGQLLLRMYDVTEGEIKLDGKNIQELDLSRLREQISYVPQDIFLFSETVSNNIGFGLDAAIFDNVKLAAKQASVEREIEGFSNQYDTMVGERGVTLSGGQNIYYSNFDSWWYNDYYDPFWSNNSWNSWGNNGGVNIFIGSPFMSLNRWNRFNRW